MEEKYPIGSEIEGEAGSVNDYAIYVKLKDFEIDGFLHANDLSYTGNPDEEIKKYKKGDKLKVKVLEIKVDEQKVRVGLKQTEEDPFNWFKDKKINDFITVKVKSSDNKGIMVSPESSNLEFLIKKSQIAISASDARPSRFVGGERIDVAISDLDFAKEKLVLALSFWKSYKIKRLFQNFHLHFLEKIFLFRLFLIN